MDAKYVTDAPVKKPTRRDAKVGVKFVVTLGYGPAVAFEAVIVERTKYRIDYIKTWVPKITSDDNLVGKRDTMKVEDVSDLIARGLMRFQPFDKDTGLLTTRPMTEAERVAADERAAKWERFVKSETYMCQ